MPCQDDGASEYYMNKEIQVLKGRLDITTRLACDYCQELELGHRSIPEWAVHWWENHKKTDLERKRKIKRDAFLKLTPEERELLGLNNVDVNKV